jgi:hypothetical protein
LSHSRRLKNIGFIDARHFHALAQEFAMLYEDNRATGQDVFQF